MRVPLGWVTAGLVLAALVAGCSDEDDGTPAATATATTGTSVTQAAEDTATPPPGEDATPVPDGPVFPTTVIQVTGDGVSETLTVEVAMTREQTSRGLMFREELAEDAGMLFVYPDGSAVGHWMKNTLIPLDIAYANEEGRIQEIREGEPLNEEILRPRIPYIYVLEVNLGWFERHGLGVGDMIEIPAELAK